MKPEALTKYERLYTNSRYMGATVILRKFLGLAGDAPVPLSLSHGVDFGHCHHPMDVDAIEPIHWSCNSTIHDVAVKSKASIMAPHPWAITVHGRTRQAGRGVLVIGPPPSPENDQRLYELIKNDVRPDWAILVKARGHHEGSSEFWRTRGVKATTAGGPDDGFYERLYEIVANHRTVVGCTFSSALVFAASIEREVVLLRNYFYEAYEPANYEDEVNFKSERARSFVGRFASGDRQSRATESQSLLGFGMLDEQERIRGNLLEAIHSLRRPFHANPLSPIPYRLAEFLALRLGKPGILRHSPREVLSVLRRRNVSVMRINDIDVWINGKSSRNFQLSPSAFKKGATVPGLAPRGYHAGRTC